MLRFDHQGTARNAGVVRRGRIILPCPGAVLILPCRNRDSLHLCLRLRIVIADIAKVGEHPGCSCRQLISIDRKNPFGYALPGGQSRLGSVSFLSFPRNCKPRCVQFQIGLVEEHHRSQGQGCTGPVRRIGMGQHIWIFNLRLRQIGGNISRQFPLVCDIHKGLLAGS